MQVILGSKNFPQSLKRPMVALGNFDGVHVAHQKMFAWSRQLAKKFGGCSVAYTFEPHPVKLLSRTLAPQLINTLEQKIELLEKQKLDAVVIEPFTTDFAQLRAEEWFSEVLTRNLHPQGVIAGYDFTFGSHRSGTVELLEQLCREAKIECFILAAQLKGETLISSSNIRTFVAKGQVGKARNLLGRPYFIDGTVIKGCGRGAAIGIPTANLESKNELLPLLGVYACMVQLNKRRYPAVANLGTNPTFKKSKNPNFSIEVHLLDFKSNLYGKKLRLFFIERLREEKTFAAPADLVAQIQRDIHRAEITLKEFSSQFSS